MPIQRLKPGTQAVEEVWDDQGGVFVQDPQAPRAPVLSYGPPRGKAKTRDVMFSCPVSAIPEPVIGLLSLWNECRLMGLPPVAGGVLEQPVSVRKAFPIFAREYEQATAEQRAVGAEFSATVATMATLQALFGGKK